MKNRNIHKAVKIAVIGLGRISFLLEKDKLRYKPCTHMGALAQLRNQGYNLSFNYLCDIKKERLSEAKEYLRSQNYDVSNSIFTENYKDINYKIIDLLIIASDTNTHFDALLIGIRHNVPKIVIEKPILMSIKDVNKIKKYILNSTSKIWVNYERRYHNAYNQIYKIINEKKNLGNALYYHGYLLTKAKSFLPQKDYEGLLLHDTTHLLDLIIYFFGNPKIYFSEKLNNDLHQINLHHNENNVKGILTSVKNSEYFHFEIEIIFEFGRIRAGNGFYYIEKSKKSKYYSKFQSLEANNKNLCKPMTARENPFNRLYKSVLDNKYQPGYFDDSLENIIILLS
ncbi:MAG: Gfo/Idh/MocA family oxidoreductase [Spirochaetia bacterium]|nr:Gfo/Idh/MocA family oxidoreductase [Spirochaetia bacterium]